MNQDDSKRIMKNLRIGMYISTTANLAAGALFMFSYIITKNFWFLVVFFLVILAAVLFIFLTRYYERKMRDALDKTNKYKVE